MSPITIADHAPLKYTPKFWDPRKAYMDFLPNVAGAYQEGVEFALQYGMKSAKKLMQEGIRNTIMLTDLQEGFRDNGELPVKGTDDVVLRTAVRIINGVVEPHFTGFVFSLDGHPIVHISFDYYYRDANGKTLDLSQHGKAACLRLHDEKLAIFEVYGFKQDGSTYVIGYYQPKFDAMDAVNYWKYLQATGQGDIWAFVPHCIIGTKGANLHPFLMEVIAFASGLLSIQATILNKGHLSNTDWFGPPQPCRPDSSHPQGGFQKQIIDDAFVPANTVEFAGVAEDFCNFYMEKQTVEYLDGTEHLAKLRFLKDGTAPIIAGAPHVAAFNAKAKAAGVLFINHDTPFES